MPHRSLAARTIFCRIPPGLPITMALLLGCTSLARAERRYFRNYTADDGLSQLVGQVLFQDRDGYLWIGTQAGLDRFDGSAFQNFGIRQGLANDWVNALAQDDSGHIWIGTAGNFARSGPAFAAAFQLEMIARNGDLSHALEGCVLLEREIERLQGVLAGLAAERGTS